MDSTQSAPSTVRVKQVTGNIWDLHRQGWYVVIPTNLFVKSDRRAVMGRGIAAQAASTDEMLTSLYGEMLLGWVRPDVPPGKEPKMTDLREESLVLGDLEAKLVFFPTKLTWGASSDPELIQKSLVSLKKWLKLHPGVEKVAIPRIGAGNGHLDWEKVVKPLMRAFLEDLDEKTRSKLVIVHPTEYLKGMGIE